MRRDGLQWCELCQQWETDAEFARRHVRALSPAEEAAALMRERAAVVVSTPVTWPIPRPRPELSALTEKVRRLRKTLGLSQSPG